MSGHPNSKHIQKTNPHYFTKTKKKAFYQPFESDLKRLAHYCLFVRLSPMGFGRRLIPVGFLLTLTILLSAHKNERSLL
jgi:hypothetical protein